MRGIAHAAIAGALYYTATKTGYFEPLILGGIIVGSYLPDADTFMSPAGWVWPVWTVSKHRHEHHSVFMSGVYLAAGLFLNQLFAVGVFLGYLMHLLMDSLTPMGCKWLWWYPGRKKAAY